jgi:hypothetical protein
MPNETPLHYPTDQRLRDAQKRLKTWSYVWIAMSIVLLIIVFTLDEPHDTGTHETLRAKCTPMVGSMPADDAGAGEIYQGQFSK